MGNAQGEDREGRPVNPARWGKTSPARSVSFWGRFLLFWLVISGLGWLSLFLFLYQFFSSPLTGGYGGSFYALRHLAEILPSVVALSMLAYVLLVGGGAGRSSRSFSATAIWSRSLPRRSTGSWAGCGRTGRGGRVSWRTRIAFACRSGRRVASKWKGPWPSWTLSFPGTAKRVHRPRPHGCERIIGEGGSCRLVRSADFCEDRGKDAGTVGIPSKEVGI